MTATALQVPPGDPSALAAAAAALDAAASVAEARADLTRGEVTATLTRAEWTGAAAEAFTANMRDLTARAEQVSPPLRWIAAATSDYATELIRAQQQARAGIALAETTAQQSAPDASTYDTAVAEVHQAWDRYHAAAAATADRIRAATRQLPTAEPTRLPHPTPRHTPWYRNVEQWVDTHASAVGHRFATTGQDLRNLLTYLAQHPEILRALGADTAGLTLGAFLLLLGFAGETAGTGLFSPAPAHHSGSPSTSPPRKHSPAASPPGPAPPRSAKTSIAPMPKPKTDLTVRPRDRRQCEKFLRARRAP